MQAGSVSRGRAGGGSGSTQGAGVSAHGAPQAQVQAGRAWLWGCVCGIQPRPPRPRPAAPPAPTARPAARTAGACCCPRVRAPSGWRASCRTTTPRGTPRPTWRCCSCARPWTSARPRGRCASRAQTTTSCPGAAAAWPSGVAGVSGGPARGRTEPGGTPPQRGLPRSSLAEPAAGPHAPLEAELSSGWWCHCLYGRQGAPVPPPGDPPRALCPAYQEEEEAGRCWVSDGGGAGGAGPEGPGREAASSGAGRRLRRVLQALGGGVWPSRPPGRALGWALGDVRPSGYP